MQSLVKYIHTHDGAHNIKSDDLIGRNTWVIAPLHISVCVCVLCVCVCVVCVCVVCCVCVCVVCVLCVCVHPAHSYA